MLKKINTQTRKESKQITVHIPPRSKSLNKKQKKTEFPATRSTNKNISAKPLKTFIRFKRKQTLQLHPRSMKYEFESHRGISKYQRTHEKWKPLTFNNCMRQPNREEKREHDAPLVVICRWHLYVKICLQFNFRQRETREINEGGL